MERVSVFILLTEMYNSPIRRKLMANALHCYILRTSPILYVIMEPRKNEYRHRICYTLI